MENCFLKVSDYIINPAQITAVELYPTGFSTVRFSDGKTIPLDESQTSSLVMMLAPLGA
jgi:hypothetical protein